MRRRPSVVLAATALGLALTGCAASEDAEATRSPATLPADAAHIHGIGRNPADGLLYLGTHAGLFVLDGEQVTRVGDAATDLMGFTVAGDDHFLSSGHPGPGDDLPNPLGLIESRDGGLTWQPVSLTGQTDFHTLSATGDTVVGFDGALRTSSDGGRTWMDGDDVQPAAVAVSPDGATVLATTERGPVRSSDGGQSFEAVDGAPVVVFLDWADTSTVWAVDPAGTLFVSTDAGGTWEQRAATGARPQAITADDTGVTVATHEGVATSTDGTTLQVLATT